MTDESEKKDDGDDEENSGTIDLHLSFPEEMESVIESHADKYYDGNISRMFRTGLRLDMEQKEGVDSVQLELMVSKVESIEERQAAKTELLEEILTKLEAVQVGISPSTSRSNALSNPSEESDLHQVAHELIAVLDEHNQPLKMDTIVKESKNEVGPVHRKLQNLIDEGIVEKIEESKDTVRYDLTNSDVKDQ